ncbi:MAG: tetratricopeptide repeat protein [Hellea sp.]
MHRATLFIIGLSLTLGTASLALAKDVVNAPNLDVLPVTRSSTGAFEMIKPLIDANAFFEAGQYEQSYKNYSAVFLHDPDNVEVLFGLAQSALYLDKGNIAEKAFNRLANYQLTPAQSSVQFSGLVLAEIVSGTSKNPEGRLKQALKVTPNNPKLWNALGQEYDAQMRWAEAWDAYKRASAKGGSKAGFHNNLGMSLLAQKKYKGAVSHFNYAVKLAPLQKQFENNWRFALLMNGDYQAALENVGEDQAAILLGDAGYIAMQREDFTLARALLEKAIEVSPRYNERAALNLEKLEARHNEFSNTESDT